ncbi:hypothetical protein [Methyloceanibacter caenitepidi]|uniref:Uncharacterized protein n=1 Tax=Methyloceanibacter caenitepidi TaxID=1384459 RepID=A0A0A8K0C2_9HYPH|nr:hypothetical protein [Methyloceanibacter caenitepidi]BAQ16355.1 hypothetical protein GL4_0894 [Methyloceanibacter caenitepidi]
MTRKSALCFSAVCASIFAFALVMFSPSQASACGRYVGYGYATTCCCSCVTYCGGYARGRGYGRAYAGYSYAYPRYGYAYPRYPYARGYARRQLRREAIRGW